LEKRITFAAIRIVRISIVAFGAAAYIPSAVLGVGALAVVAGVGRPVLLRRLARLVAHHPVQHHRHLPGAAGAQELTGGDILRPELEGLLVDHHGVDAGARRAEPWDVAGGAAVVADEGQVEGQPRRERRLAAAAQVAAGAVGQVPHAARARGVAPHQVLVVGAAVPGPDVPERVAADDGEPVVVVGDAERRGLVRPEALVAHGPGRGVVAPRADHAPHVDLPPEHVDVEHLHAVDDGGRLGPRRAVVGAVAAGDVEGLLGAAARRLEVAVSDAERERDVHPAALLLLLALYGGCRRQRPRRRDECNDEQWKQHLLHLLNCAQSPWLPNWVATCSTTCGRIYRCWPGIFVRATPKDWHFRKYHYWFRFST
jgi:hypothetical protein